MASAEDVRLPAHAISMLPSLQAWPLSRPGVNRSVGTILDNRSVVFTASGTAAIALALSRLEGIRGSSVLLPAYNCPSMVEAVRIVGAIPAFYGTTRTLRIEGGHLAAATSVGARAAIVPHFFGRTQDVSLLRTHPGLRDLVIIEDCAHAWFGGLPASPIGSVGDFAIASCPKFFPVLRGGVLASSRHDLSTISLEPPSLLADLRQALALLEDGALHGSTGIAHQIVARLNALRRRGRGSDSVIALTQGTSYSYIDEHDLIRSAGRTAEWIVTRSSAAALCAKRSSRYGQIASVIRGCSRARLLWDEVPGAAPYVVPVILEEPAADYPRLRAMGLRLYRWDESVRRVCEHADFLAERLIQLPCHQSLTDEEADRVCDVLRDVLT